MGKAKLFKEIIIFNFYLLLINLSYAQKPNTPEATDYNIVMQHTLFVTKDSTYKLTRFIEKEGIKFYRDFIPLNDVPNNDIMFFDQKRKKDSLIVWKLKYRLEKDVDTLYSLYMDHDIYPLPSEFNYREEIVFIEDELCEDAVHCYVLREFGVTMLYSRNAYQLCPVPFSKKTKDHFEFELFIIKNWESEGSDLYFKYGGYNEQSGFEFSFSDSTIIKKKTIKSLRSSLNDFIGFKPTLCLRPGKRGELYLLYIDAQKYLMAEDCISEGGIKNPNPVKKLGNFFAIERMFRNYINYVTPAQSD